MKGMPLVMFGAIGIAGLYAMFTLGEKERKEVERAFKRWRYEQRGIPSLDETWRGAVRWQKQRPSSQKARALEDAARRTHRDMIKQTVACIESQIPDLPPAAVGIAAVSMTRRALPALHEALYRSWPEPEKTE